MRDEAMASIDRWLEAWAKAIREQDFEAGAALFDPNASGFGTITQQTTDFDDLLENQWRPVWTRTKDFRFDFETRSARLSSDALFACVFAQWDSLGVSEEGETRERRGRATMSLRRDSLQAPWRCEHTHFSMWPHARDEEIFAVAQR